mgnify:CR=1 FL=1
MLSITNVVGEAAVMVGLTTSPVSVSITVIVKSVMLKSTGHDRVCVYRAVYANTQFAASTGVAPPTIFALSISAEFDPS